MKLQYISDIHLEFHKKLPKLIPVADVLILAGDIGYPHSKIYLQFLKEVNSNFKKVFLITGNHEYYNNKDMEEVDMYIQGILEEHQLNNITFLNCSYEDYEGFRFVGATLWTNIHNPRKIINDMNQIQGFTVELNNELHEIHKQFLSETINLSSLPVIVITHHLPSFTLINKEFLTESMNPYNQCFASNCELLVKAPVKVWIYGHTHKENSIEINSVNLTCNPLGYPSEYWNIDIRDRLKKYIQLE